MPRDQGSASSERAGELLRLFAVATPGLESALAAEVQALTGARDVEAVPGGVEFSGDLAVLYRANLWLRTASRVLLRLGEFRAVHFASLHRQMAQLSWERFAAAAVRVSVAATAHRCRLYHSGGVAERIISGITDRGIRVLREDAGDPLQQGDAPPLRPRSGVGKSPLPAPGLSRPRDRGRAALLPQISPTAQTAAVAATPELHLVARGQDDVFTISIDTSGELLHRRGYRVEDTGAPLRETLAAGLLQLTSWDGTMPLCDPTCGSGTLVIEAALLATGRAPGRERSFAFQSWPTFRPAVWSALLAEADAAVHPGRAGLLYAADRSPEAVVIARRNAARAGVESLIAWSVTDAAQARLPAGPPGLVLCNPPYGVRLGGPQLLGLYKSLGRLSRSAPGWRLGVLTSDPQLARATGPSAHSHALFSGGLRVTLYVTAPTRGAPSWAVTNDPAAPKDGAEAP